MNYSKTQIVFIVLSLLLAVTFYFFHFEEQTRNYLITAFCFSVFVWFGVELYGKIKDASKGTYLLADGIKGISKSLLASYLFGMASMACCVVYFMARLHLFG